MLLENKKLCDSLEEILRNSGSPDIGHGLGHAKRVLKNALEISKNENSGNEKILVASAYLHDLVDLPKNHPDRSKASLMSSEASVPILKSLNVDDIDIKQIRHAIESHSFSGKIKPETIEACILQDADRLEALGAIGIARVFAVSGQIGRPLFYDEDPFAFNREIDGKHYGLDHFATKLLKLPDMMLTNAGKQEGLRRVAFMRTYLNMLANEFGYESMNW